jgi:hypothetical protein
MDTPDTNENNEQLNNSEPEESQEELSHSDKMFGVLTEPSKTFDNIAKFPPRTKDWFIPVLILFLLAALIQRITLMNEEIYFEVIQEQTKEIEKQVESGELSREEADGRIEATKTFISGPIGWITTFISMLFVGFIFFFIVVTFYFLMIKLVIKDEGKYTSAMVATGLSMYIGIIQVLLAGIFTLILEMQVKDTSLAAFLDMDRLTISGWLLAKVNPISIWYYMVLSIGLAKMFKSENTIKYYVLVFVSWIVVSLILFFLAKSIPGIVNLI